MRCGRALLALTECHEGVSVHRDKEKSGHTEATPTPTHTNKNKVHSFLFLYSGGGGRQNHMRTSTHTYVRLQKLTKKKEEQVYIQRILQCPPHLPTQVFWEDKNETQKNLGGRGR